MYLHWVTCQSARYDRCIWVCECYCLVISFVFWIVEFLGLAARSIFSINWVSISLTKLSVSFKFRIYDILLHVVHTHRNLEVSLFFMSNWILFCWQKDSIRNFHNRDTVIEKTFRYYCRINSKMEMTQQESTLHSLALKKQFQKNESIWKILQLSNSSFP